MLVPLLWPCEALVELFVLDDVLEDVELTVPLLVPLDVPVDELVDVPLTLDVPLLPPSLVELVVESLKPVVLESFVVRELLKVSLNEWLKLVNSDEELRSELLFLDQPLLLPYPVFLVKELLVPFELTSLLPVLLPVE